MSTPQTTTDRLRVQLHEELGRRRGSITIVAKEAGVTPGHAYRMLSGARNATAAFIETASSVLERLKQQEQATAARMHSAISVESPLTQPATQA